MINSSGDYFKELHHPDVPVPQGVQSAVTVTSFGRLMDALYNWGRRNSVWPMFLGLACCAIEMIATASSRFDQARFGMELLRASPRQADLMIASGTVTKKMIVPIVRLYNQMSEPKYVLAMGACAIGGGPFKEGYGVVSGLDKYIPVDVYVPGCPPTPQALLYGFLMLHKKINGQSLGNRNSVPWYSQVPEDDVPVPVLGPDIIDPRQAYLLRRATTTAGEAHASA